MPNFPTPWVVRVQEENGRIKFAVKRLNQAVMYEMPRANKTPRKETKDFQKYESIQSGSITFFSSKFIRLEFQ